MGSNDLIAAAKTWNKRDETVDEANRRIHDGVPLELLEARADGYVRTVFDYFPFALPCEDAAVMEIGSGTGYIMQAINRHLQAVGRPPESIVGLDIAENMIAKAQQRLGDAKPFAFVHYDGISIPRPDRSYDLIYSVACLQHVPKPYVYNLFFEIHRLLKPGAYGIINLLSFKNMVDQEPVIPWKSEIRAQIDQLDTHWHFFYSAEELAAVLSVGTKFGYVNIQDAAGLYVCVRPTPLDLPNDFDEAAYLRLNSDVAEAGVAAAQHWLTSGHKEGRRWR